MLTTKDYILENLVEEAKNDEGINLQDLRDGDLVTLETKNHTYKLFLRDVKNRKADFLSNNPSLSFLNPVSIKGSLPHQFSSYIRQGWIMNYWCLELNLDGVRLVTGYVKSVSVNGSKIFPILENATLQ